MSLYEQIKGMTEYELAEFIIEKFQSGLEVIYADHCKFICPNREVCKSECVEIEQLYCMKKSEKELVKRWLTYNKKDGII